MLKRVFLFFVLLNALSCAFGEPIADHPLIGAWSILLPDGCAETLILRRDRTLLVISGAQISESEVNLSDEPRDSGFYRWEDRVVSDNGRRDCSGDVVGSGSIEVVYIRLLRSNEAFFMCVREDSRTCIGPFSRSDGTDV